LSKTPCKTKPRDKGECGRGEKGGFSTGVFYERGNLMRKKNLTA